MDSRQVKKVKLDTFLMTSYSLSHLFQNLFSIYITLRIFSLCKSLKLQIRKTSFQSQTQIWKKTIFLVEAVKQKYICYPNKCLLDLYTLSGYPKILNVWNIYLQYCNSRICIWTYTIHSFKTTKWKYRTCFHFLLCLDTVCIKQ